MDVEQSKEAMAKHAVADNASEDFRSGTTSTAIYIDPEKEAAARRKFDKYLLPVSVIFLVLSTLDRNNVSKDPFPHIPTITNN